jgi:hypothetical protein
MKFSVNGPKPRGDGYVGHNVAGKTKLEHVLVAELALGKPLPPGAQVHHWDRDRSNNAPSNLVICPDQAYHRLIHRRMAALEACGNPNWMSCRLCRKYDDPANLYVSPNGVHAYHRECSAAYARAHRAKQKQEKGTGQHSSRPSQQPPLHHVERP